MSLRLNRRFVSLLVGQLAHLLIIVSFRQLPEASLGVRHIYMCGICSHTPLVTRKGRRLPKIPCRILAKIAYPSAVYLFYTLPVWTFPPFVFAPYRFYRLKDFTIWPILQYYRWVIYHLPFASILGHAHFSILPFVTVGFTVFHFGEYYHFAHLSGLPYCQSRRFAPARY